MKPKAPDNLWQSFDKLDSHLAAAETAARSCLVPVKSLAKELNRNHRSIQKFLRSYNVPTKMVPFITAGGIQDMLCIDRKTARKIRRLYHLLEGNKAKS